MLENKSCEQLILKGPLYYEKLVEMGNAGITLSGKILGDFRLMTRHQILDLRFEQHKTLKSVKTL